MTDREASRDPAADALFHRFRESGDPAALGAFFDRVAGDLFRIAVSLCGDGAAAEDAVQETFLAALRGADAFDPARPVMPRLLAILAHKAADARRSARRVPDPLRLEPRLAEPDPATEAERREAVARVREALDRLPDPYRAAALLRWEYGLEPGDIARVLGAPPGTVRSLLSRARERLARRLRGVPLLGLLLHRPGRGLGAVRDAVLGEAAGGAAAGTAAAAVTGGMLMANKGVLAAAAALLLIGGAGWWVVGRGGGEESPGGEAVTAHVSHYDTLPATAPPAPEAAAVAGAIPLPDSLPCPLHVEVVDGAGRPLPGAAVECRARAERDLLLPSLPGRDDLLDAPAVAATAGADGAAEFRLATGPWAVGARAPGFGAAAATTDLRLGAAPPRLRLVLFPAATLEGRVLRAPGDPRPGVRVEASPVGNDGPYARTGTTADAEGRYRLEGLPQGNAILSVLLPSGLRVVTGVVALPGTTHLDLLVPGGLTVRGRVVDDTTGAPVAGAEVALSLANMATSLGSGGTLLSAADGGFAFEDLPPWRVGGIQVRSEGYLSWPDGLPGSELDGEGGEGLVVVRAPGAPFEREIRLQRGSAVRGTVTRADGAPVAGARVSYVGRLPDGGGMAQPRTSPTAVSGEDGRYEVPCVLPGRNVARVEATGLSAPGAAEALMVGTPEDPRWTVEVPADGPAEKDLVLSAGCAVEGVVLGPDGAPLAGARVGRMESTFEQWRGPVVATGADGGFRLEAVPPGTFRFLARGPGEVRGTSSLVTGIDGQVAGPVRIETVPGAILAGTVLDGEGAPVAGARLALHRGGVALPGQGDAVRRAWLRAAGEVRPVAPDGAFRITGLDPGTWTIHALAPGRAPDFRTVEGVRAGTAAEDLRLVLVPGRRLSGRVVDGAGAPLPGIAVGVLPDPGSTVSGLTPSATATTDGEGRFLADDLEEGPLLVRVEAAGFAPFAELVAAEVGEVEVRLSAPLSIEGRLSLEGGGPAAGVTIAVFAEKRVPGVLGMVETASDGKGRYRVEGLAPGACSLYFGGFNSDLVQVKRTGVEAGSKGVDAVLQRGAAIRGNVRNDRGRPLPGAQVRVQGEGEAGSGVGRNGLATTGSDGTFAIRGLLPGTYTVTAYVMDPLWIAPPPLTGVRPGEGEIELRATSSGGGPPPGPEEGDLTIAGTVVLRGGGAPPEGTQVVAFPEKKPPAGQPVFLVPAATDARGGFVIEKLPAGRYRVIAAHRSKTLAPGWLPGPTEAGTAGLVIEVEPGRRLSGRLTGDSAAGIRWVRALPPGAPSGLFPWTEVLEGGGYTCDLLPEGAARLEGRPQEGPVVDLGPVEVE